jgi:hypothetical protein
LPVDEGVEVLLSQKLIDLLATADFAERFLALVLLPLEDIGGGFAVQADQVFGSGHGNLLSWEVIMAV